MRKIFILLILTIFLSGCWLFPDINEVNEMTIDIGNSATNRASSGSFALTMVDKNNPANATGKITEIKIYIVNRINPTSVAGVKVATFYADGNNLTTRDSVSLGTVESGAVRTFTVDLEVHEGDYIGVTASGTGGVERDDDSGVGYWTLIGDYIPCTDELFSFYADRTISLYGTGIIYTIPTVTTQAVTSILSTTATGNGNITATGGENATERGVCYNTTGSPTTSDSKIPETGDFGTGAFTSSITELSPGIKYYVKAYAINEAGTAYGAEVNFTTDKVAPTVTTQDPSAVLSTTVTANGNITALGGENSTVRGFKYGLTQVDTWSASDSGSFSAGAFTKGLTGLLANTTYWIIAYATNSIGTSYGDWIQFQTAAAGTIPTGTKLDICSDYSGYTYQLQRSETDDGDSYTAYFVISTDLSNKSALAFYKRILDLHLYFNSETSGTVTVEVKRDNEAVWQAVGSVALTGTADIIIKHLATRIYGKHFLFKISAANKFEFLGCLFQFVPGGMR